MTVEETLRQTGFTTEQIAGLDQRAIGAFSNVLATADQQQAEAAAARQAAEAAQQANADFYDLQIAPALNNWGNEKAQRDAEVAYYRSQLESARQSGFLPTEAPNYNPNDQPRDAQGRYVSGAPGSVPGSPTFTMNQVRDGLGSTIGTLSDIQWKYQSLYGKPMPIAPTELVRQAEAQRLDPAEYASRTFKFRDKEQEVAKAQHDAEIASATKKAVEENDRKWAERVGSNPNIRMGESSRYGDVARAVKSGERPDPLGLNAEQRRQATSAAIRKDIAEESAA